MRLAQKLNHTWTTVYNFEVIAMDGGVIPRYGRAKVEVVIVVSNENRPEFEEDYYEAKVDENAPVGTSVLQVIATDNDQGPSGTIMYSFVDGSNSDGAFNIHITTGVINTAIDLNRQNKYTLVVQASDQGSPPLTSTTRIYITIIKSDAKPVKQSILFTGGGSLFVTGGPKTTTEAIPTTPPNRYHPQFSEDSYLWTIHEDADIGTLVAVVSASDDDAHLGGQVKYSIEPDDLAEFTIDEISGSIKVAEALSGSRGSVFFRVIATDQHPGKPRSSSVDVEVVVAEINRHPPIFEKDFYEARVKENALRYSRVIQVTATDADTGRNGRIRYTFQAGKNGAGTFAIDRSLGIIRILKLLDRELISEYDLVVEATDTGIPKFKAEVPVHVIIRDVNDNAPKFSGYYLRMYIMENGPPFQLVGKIAATDADEGSNADIRYAMLLDSLDAYKFQLDFRTGDLHALDSLDREEQSEYRVTIRAASPLSLARL
ncbi:cadherin EGF LAG seven-pass G-type receptor 1-like [Amphiura filiformis]|uniref:cadherin EGF LAG seven-pass G-type receptor 1-like n=1 Tax=Amphiura filiformis TaxID=82378 RepID=UPI003B210E20